MPLNLEVFTNAYPIAIDWFNQTIFYYQEALAMENDLVKQNPRPLFTLNPERSQLAIDPYTR